MSDQAEKLTEQEIADIKTKLSQLQQENIQLTQNREIYESIQKISQNPLQQIQSYRKILQTIQTHATFSYLQTLLNTKQDLSNQQSQLFSVFSLPDLSQRVKFTLQLIPSLYQAIQNLKTDFESLKSQNNSLKQQSVSKSESKENQNLIRELKIEIEQVKGSESITQLEYQNLKASTKDWLQQLNSTKSHLKEVENQSEKHLGTINSLKFELEDARTERQIIQKRSKQDLKDLKDEYVKQKRQHEKCRERKEILDKEVEQLVSTQRRNHSVASAVPENEKIIMEHQSIRINELEAEVYESKGHIEKLECDLYSSKELIKQQFSEIEGLQGNLMTMGSHLNQVLRDNLDYFFPILDIEKADYDYN